MKLSYIFQDCVRELEMIRNIKKEDQDKITEIFAHYQCDRNGNYRPMQCTESVCYCVDDYGFAQDSNAILKTDVEGIKKLNGTCYNNRGMNIIQKENFYF